MTICRKILPLAIVISIAVASVVLAGRKTLFEGKSDYTETIIVTEDDQGLRTLWFEKNGDRQSSVKVGDPDHLELEYTRVMPVALAFVPKPKRILIVGLGGGSIPNFLHKHYPKAVVDVVDIDPVVVDVARKYFDFREDATLRAHVDDGRKFIERNKDPYDIIFLDAYGSENIPYHLATREFLQAVRKALKPKGVVASNIFSRGLNRLHDSMMRTYEDVFEELHVLDVKNCGNEILFALPYKSGMKRDDMARRAEAISKEKAFRFGMGELVKYGYRRPDKDIKRGSVLTDKKKPAK